MFHHTGHVQLVLLALAFKEIDDDSKTSRADFRIIAVLILVQSQESNNQNQGLYGCVLMSESHSSTMQILDL